MHTALVCSACGRDHEIDRPQNLCRACAKPLLARYDLAAVRGRFTPEAVRSRPVRSMWRFHEVLPVTGAQDAVTLGEGLTPLLPAARGGALAELENLWIKDESFAPTGSFKARGMAAAVTRAKHLGIGHVALPSAGNAAGAAAAYAARAGMRCTLFVPADTPPANVAECIVLGARVYLVRGLISDCGRLVGEGRERFGWFDLSTLKEPFRIEGKKTMGYELALDLADALGQSEPVLPDVILYPTGGGTGLIGMWKAFDEMQELDWIGPERPRMVVVQAAGCAPIVRAWQEGKREAVPFPDAHTVASGLRVPAAVGDFLMLDILRRSRGRAIAVTDEELLEGQRQLAAEQGIFACPEAGAVWTAAQKLHAEGWIGPDERVVLFNTGTGLKYTHLIEPDLPVIDPADPHWHESVSA